MEPYLQLDTAQNKRCQSEKAQEEQYTRYTFADGHCIPMAWDNCSTMGSNNFESMEKCVQTCTGG
ncbi:Kunitz/Bovine pancreatic trypsin inhibitor domain protein [Oesophagostomum dentatum]|uniref:Kunitz/Bovine pancreatic trypsin inhibitor domain protein n=1 Tax=Oesophagostomum dentatum TaxID=61180 RepID=A0A0B1SZG8_OESDE|nr:Kunitz/Bovine pancreatic trypsin inhibitor domain protein [Oesophagostomum dentatum]